MEQIVNTVFDYDVIMAHGPGCNDGATSAWAIWRILPESYRVQLSQVGGFYSVPKYDEEVESTAETSHGLHPVEPFIHPNSPEGALRLQEKGFPVVFVFIQPSEGVPDKLIANKRVLVLDLDMGDALISLVRSASFVLLSDHHDSTPGTIQKHSQFLLDENRHKFATYVNTSKRECGATLAWRLSHTAQIPPFVEIVRIGDTWQWDDYPQLHARAVLKSLYIRRAFRSFHNIEQIFQTWDEKFDSYVQQGYSVSEYETSVIRQMAKQCDLGFVQTNDGTVYTVAYTQASVLHSEVGSSMKWYAQKRFKMPIDFCATWKYASYKGLVSVSLRDPEEGINLAVVARNIKGTDGKGGGHAAAAGFAFYGLENFHNFILKSVPIVDARSNVTQQEISEFITLDSQGSAVDGS